MSISIKFCSINKSWLSYLNKNILLIAISFSLISNHARAQDSEDEFDKEFSKFETQINKGSIADPYEKINRQIFKFNDKVDKYFLEGVARSYRKAIPKPARLSIRNFLDNLSLPLSSFNSIIQGKPDNALATFSSFLINSTLGLGGFIDVASKKGITYEREDFGQTLGYYGIEANSYIVLPLIGPSTSRDFSGFMIDRTIDPMAFNILNIGGQNNQIIDNQYRIANTFAKVVDNREEFLDILDNIRKDSFDPYATIRSAYLQRRIAQIEK